MRVSLIVIFSFFFFAWGYAQKTGKNIVKGTVLHPGTQKKIVKGTGYNKDGTAMMQSDDPLAKIENNIIVIAYPTQNHPNLPPTKNAIITQKAQTFLPHVLPITKGSTVYFLNEDQFFHNIYSLTPGAKFNIGRRPPGSPYPIEIKQSGLLTLSCDIHSHMKGYILSLETPYFSRVDKNGHFTIAELPDGEYRVEVFNLFYMKIEKTVQLKNEKVLELNFDLAKGKKP